MNSNWSKQQGVRSRRKERGVVERVTSTIPISENVN